MEEIISILERLGFSCKNEKETIYITIPSWRYDVSIKEDIVEEIVRIYGYDKIPVASLPDSNVQKIINRQQRRLMDIKRLLAGNGYTEVVSWSFMDSKKAKLFSEIKEELIIQNPISAELDYMRPSILPNLLKIACNNIMVITVALLSLIFRFREVIETSLFSSFYCCEIFII